MGHKMHGIGMDGKIRTDVTRHARMRMHARTISDAALEAVLTFGRVAHVRGAQIRAIGRREVKAGKRIGTDLSRFEGIHVVFSPDGRAVLTAYRNHDFRGLRRY